VRATKAQDEKTVNIEESTEASGLCCSAGPEEKECESKIIKERRTASVAWLKLRS
jgi:hypothetical protein